MKKIPVILISLLFLLAGCSNDSDDYIPEEEKQEEKEKTYEDLLFTKEDPGAKGKLIGRWYVTYNGFGEDRDTYDPLYTVEFMPDGTYRQYTRSLNDYDEYIEEHTYQISDEYYYQNYIWPDDIPEETRGGGEWIYTYKFYEDKLRLDLVWGIYTFHDVYIFKRLEEK